MAQSKRERASMREGPLAALFRKTEEDETSAQDTPPQESEAQASAASARASEEEPEARVEPEVKPKVEARPKARQEPAQERLAEEVAAVEVEEDEDAARIPSPRERLRNVFSGAIPADVVVPPPAPEATAGQTA